ncbi:hypothetical protein OSC52_08915 [Clostridium pasteurianum]|uniref:hypothetical protein n=1 Tax=Clostridium pasteurianum TaxID=1501 RepID=UPI00226103EB|nr:hypothetical protein [Clostridium pasteurianum]UZW15916.1 hypothetical protein OSC52_08915 [Clostridium pasteurianum]
MNSVYPWLYLDYADNIWKFWVNDNGELLYNIMYEEGKWTKENVIDKDVLEFTVYIQEVGKINIVYSNYRGELKYCTMRHKQWIGKILYTRESDRSQIQNLKIQIIGKNMHIFYMLISEDGTDHGILMHCKWNGRETAVNALQDIILLPNVEEYYKVSLRGTENLDMIFITDEGNEASVYYCSFQKNQWTPLKRLYGIQGENISLQILSDESEISILNRSKENSVYILDHVTMDINGVIKGFRVYDTNNKLIEPILFTESNILYCCWLEQGGIFYSIFDGEGWGDAMCIESGSGVPLQKYNACIFHKKYNSIDEREVYVTDETDLSIYIPSEFVKRTKNISEDHGNEEAFSLSQPNDKIKNIKIELHRTKVINKNLDKKLSALNMQLQKKQRFIEEYEENISKVLKDKRKLEENYKAYLEVHENSQKELQSIKEKLLEEKSRTDITEKRLQETEEYKESLENQVKKFEEEKNMLQKEMERKVQENIRLQQELEMEKNQSIMDRLLRRK